MSSFNQEAVQISSGQIDNNNHNSSNNNNDNSASNTTKSSTQSAVLFSRGGGAGAGGDTASSSNRARSATLPAGSDGGADNRDNHKKTEPRQGGVDKNKGSRTVSRDRSATSPTEPPLSSHQSRASYIHMNDSIGSVTASASAPTTTSSSDTPPFGGGGNNSSSRTPSRSDYNHSHAHARQESGYQSSTIGSSSLPPMTIGVKRGSDLLASRRGPQIVGANHPATMGGSAPPLGGGAGGGGSGGLGMNPAMNASGHRIGNLFNTTNTDGHGGHIHDGGSAAMALAAAEAERGDLRNMAMLVGLDPKTLPLNDPNAMREAIARAGLALRRQEHGDDGYAHARRQYEGSGTSEEEGGRDEEDDLTEDDGIEPADGYIDEDISEVDNYATLPQDADPERSVLNKGQPFYQLQGPDGAGRNGKGSAESRSHVLSTEALAARMLAGLTGDATAATASLTSLVPSSRNVSGGTGFTAHNEAIRQYQQARDAATLAPPAAAAQAVTSKALGSPFNEPTSTDQQLPANNSKQDNHVGKSSKAMTAGAMNTAAAASAAGMPSKEKRNQLHQAGTGAATTTRKPKGATAAGVGLGLSSSVPASQGRHLFPSKGNTSGNPSSATLQNTALHGQRAVSYGQHGNGGNGGSAFAKRHPPVAAPPAAGRTRKMSSASDASVKKDDLLERLASALKAERKLVALYQEELQSAETELNKILAAEAERDEEMARLEARHARDKQVISALKLRCERQMLELSRAEDVPAHEAEAYLDLLSSRPSSGNDRTGAAVKRVISGAIGAHDQLAFSNSELVNSALKEHTGDLPPDDERSIRGLLAEQDVLNGTWTRTMVEKEDKRRKAFAKKRKTLAKEVSTAPPPQPIEVWGSADEEAAVAAMQAEALASAGLDKRPPGHTRKLSFKDSLKKTFGLKNTSSDKINIMRVTPVIIPTISSPPSSSPIYPQEPSSSAMSRTISAPPPTSQLPPIPIDPNVNAKDAKAQNKRLARLAAEQSGMDSGVGLLPGGTYGRSASMDVQTRNFLYIPGNMSNPVLPTSSGYSSDTDVVSSGGGGRTGVRGFLGLNKSGKPPVVGVGRYGGGVAGGRDKTDGGRTRKLSFPGLKRSNSGNSSLNGGNSSAGSGGGFFKQLFPTLDSASPAAGSPRIQVGYPTSPASHSTGLDRWKKRGERVEKTWSQQLPNETTVIHG